MLGLEEGSPSWGVGRCWCGGERGEGINKGRSEDMIRGCWGIGVASRMLGDLLQTHKFQQ